jgi:hypothetical protein
MCVMSSLCLSKTYIYGCLFTQMLLSSQVNIRGQTWEWESGVVPGADILHHHVHVPPYPTLAYCL